MKRVLLLEDDFLIAYDLKLQIEGAGIEVLGPVSSNADAAALLASNSVDAAILDMDLGGSSSFETAHRLREAGIPFLFVSGNDKAALDEELSGSMVHTKPVSVSRLIATLKSWGVAS